MSNLASCFQQTDVLLQMRCSTLRSLYRGAIRQSMSDIKRMDLAASESSGCGLYSVEVCLHRALQTHKLQHGALQRICCILHVLALHTLSGVVCQTPEHQLSNAQSLHCGRTWPFAWAPTADPAGLREGTEPPAGLHWPHSPAILGLTVWPAAKCPGSWCPSRAWLCLCPPGNFRAALFTAVHASGLLGGETHFT